jgi:hypothetical protein
MGGTVATLFSSGGGTEGDRGGRESLSAAGRDGSDDNIEGDAAAGASVEKVRAFIVCFCCAASMMSTSVMRAEGRIHIHIAKRCHGAILLRAALLVLEGLNGACSESMSAAMCSSSSASCSASASNFRSNLGSAGRRMGASPLGCLTISSMLKSRAVPALEPTIRSAGAPRVSQGGCTLG